MHRRNVRPVRNYQPNPSSRGRRNIFFIVIGAIVTYLLGVFSVNIDLTPFLSSVFLNQPKLSIDNPLIVIPMDDKGNIGDKNYLEVNIVNQGSTPIQVSMGQIFIDNVLLAGGIPSGNPIGKNLASPYEIEAGKSKDLLFFITAKPPDPVLAQLIEMKMGGKGKKSYRLELSTTQGKIEKKGVLIPQQIFAIRFP